MTFCQASIVLRIFDSETKIVPKLFSSAEGVTLSENHGETLESFLVPYFIIKHKKKRTEQLPTTRLLCKEQLFKEPTCRRAKYLKNLYYFRNNPQGTS